MILEDTKHTGVCDSYKVFVQDKKLFAPLGIRHQWKRTYLGVVDTEGGLYLNGADLSKIGYLYLNHGVWDGKRLISQSWIEQSVMPAIIGKAIDAGVTQDDTGALWFWGMVLLGVGMDEVGVVAGRDDHRRAVAGADVAQGHQNIDRPALEMPVVVAELVPLDACAGRARPSACTPAAAQASAKSAFSERKP